MHQLKVFRCDICQAPFLFESSLEDHKNTDHEPKDGNPTSVEKSIDPNKKQRKGAKAKRKQTGT